MLTFAELDHVVCKLAYRFKRPYPFANIFCLKNVHHLCKTRLLKIRKNAFEFQTKIQKHSAMVRGAVKKTDILQGRIPLPDRMNFWKSAKGGGHFQKFILQILGTLHRAF